MTGRPIWYELMTPDPSAVAPFYRALFGWDTQSQSAKTPTGHPYWMIGRAEGGHAGGVLLLTADMQVAGGRAGWLTYFEVDDVAATVAQATALGAQVWMPPMKMDVGTMAMLGDPQGASFYVMDPIPPAGQPDAQSDVFEPNTPGHAWWNELQTPDEPASTAFYKALFDWSADNAMPMGDKGEYRFVEHDGNAIGAINPWMPDWMGAGWLPYFGVADIDAAREAAASTGGTIRHDIHEVPGGDFIFTAADPSGAPLGVVGKRGA